MTYVLAWIGCLECGHPSELLAVSDDLDTIKARWDAETVDWIRYGPNAGKSAPFERFSDADHEEWPPNAIAITWGRESKLVVFEWPIVIYAEPPEEQP